MLHAISLVEVDAAFGNQKLKQPKLNGTMDTVVGDWSNSKLAYLMDMPIANGDALNALESSQNLAIDGWTFEKSTKVVDNFFAELRMDVLEITLLEGTGKWNQQ